MRTTTYFCGVCMKECLAQYEGPEEPPTSSCCRADLLRPLNEDEIADLADELREELKS